MSTQSIAISIDRYIPLHDQIVFPPSTGQQAPVTKDACSLNRKTITLVTSSGCAARAMGFALSVAGSPFASLGTVLWVIGVSINPGATVLIRMFFDPTSAATEAQRPITACLEAAYTGAEGRALIPAADATVT